MAHQHAMRCNDAVLTISVRGSAVVCQPLCGCRPAQGRVHHIGTFPQLEDQMTNFTSDIDRAAAGYSPDRVDALVWAFSELLVEPMNGEGKFEFYRQYDEVAAQRSKPRLWARRGRLGL
jgi:phage terminase large subunit-like protein